MEEYMKEILDGIIPNRTPKLEIQMVNKERQSGKTSFLKLQLHENINLYNYVLVLGWDYRRTIELKKYYQLFYRGIFHELMDIAKFKDQNILVLIDEPFLISPEKQEELLKFFKARAVHNYIKVLGIGTKPKRHIPVFEKIENSGL